LQHSVFLHAEPNPKKSEEAKRLICDEIECAEVFPPGGERTVVKLEESHKLEYAAEYAAWKATQAQPASGTPLSEWTMLPKSTCEELRYLGFSTVEQVAEANDAAKQKMGPLQNWCKKAKEWVDSAGCKQNEVAALKEKAERLEKKVKKLEEQNEILIQRIEANEGIRLRDNP
jgi:hypothetical protein